MIPRNTHELGDAAAQNPGKTALIGLLSSPLALKAGGIALRWARRHPVLAIAAAAGAYAWYRKQNAGTSYGGYGAGGTGMGLGGSSSQATGGYDDHRSYESGASRNPAAERAFATANAAERSIDARTSDAGTPGLGAASGPSPTGIGGRASGVAGDADGWSGGRSGGTISQGQGVAGSGASAPSIVGGSAGSESARAGL